jgi:hypothetical protein
MKLNRKKTLITSLIAMILCMVMLAGATYAAFSDKAALGIEIGTANFNMTLSYDDPQVDGGYVALSEANEYDSEHNTCKVSLQRLVIDGTWSSKTYLFKVANDGGIAFDLSVAVSKKNTPVAEATTPIDSDTVLSYYAKVADSDAALVGDTKLFGETNADTSADIITEEEPVTVAATNGVMYVALTINCSETLAPGSYSTINLVITFTAKQA